MKVLLLSGGKSIERDVSFRSGKTISDALDELGYEYENFDPVCTDDDLVKKAKDFDVVFIALHGKPGEDGVLQELFEKNGIKYTASRPDASKLCIDKWKFKKLLEKNGIPVSRGKIVTLDDLDDDIFQAPYVLKPNTEGSSLDTLIIRNITPEARKQREFLLNKYPDLLAEVLIEGPEITVGIFDDKALPVIEIIPPEDEEFDYENKYNGKTRELIPPINVSEEIQKTAQEISLKIHKLANCLDMSRTDFMVDKSGKLYVLETNTIPGLTNQSLLPKMIQYSGTSMTEFVDKLLKNALSRQS